MRPTEVNANFLSVLYLDFPILILVSFSCIRHSLFQWFDVICCADHHNLFQVVPVESAIIRSLTLRNQRCYYIRESVLVRTPNDPLVAVLGALIRSANEQIICELVQENKFFQELFKCLEPGANAEKREAAVKALRQIFRTAQGSGVRTSLSRYFSSRIVSCHLIIMIIMKWWYGDDF
jgi:hypothetical protein